MVTGMVNPDHPDYGDFPLRRFLGMDVGSVAGGRATATVDADEDHLNPNGVVHGAVGGEGGSPEAETR